MKISVSTNPPREQDLLQYVVAFNDKNVDYIHCDVMDGKFVESKTFNYKFLPKINQVTTLPLDVHLMVAKPWRVYKKYVKNGACILTTHFEAYKNSKQLIKTLNKLRQLGVFVGLSFCPQTKVCDILPFVPYVDVLLVMSVVPGKSGQTFIDGTISRVKEVKQYIDKTGFDTIIEVDGGVNASNICALKDAGAEIVVLGNYLYSSQNIESDINKIKNA